MRVQTSWVRSCRGVAAKVGTVFYLNCDGKPWGHLSGKVTRLGSSFKRTVLALSRSSAVRQLWYHNWRGWWLRFMEGMRSAQILDGDTHRMFSEVRSGVWKTSIKNDKVSGLGEWKGSIPVVRWRRLRKQQIVRSSTLAGDRGVRLCSETPVRLLIGGGWIFWILAPRAQGRGLH